MNEDFIHKAKHLQLLLTDVDGVLTDSKLCWYTDGEGRLVQIKNFESLDGMGMLFLRACGVRTGIISRGNAPVLTHWAELLGMDVLYRGAPDKKTALLHICRDMNVSPEQTAFIGDDIIDLGALKIVGLPLSVANAVQEVKEASVYVSAKRGGEGAVREICEQILKARGQWDDLVRQVETGAFKDPRPPLHIVNADPKK